ncbi:interleukin-13 receptor subunit alpha-1-like isoform X2 [Tachysurus fulvidraco]|uniref:interleukin-13 receptor subunit alpha-1-like isoform X2 n=1 Tax=Tachysurus fulvidraco TaxID=1234273 RepID=UPI000F500664|nr:interleukin-13 receptor subunit alpha-1-like isoform X2 [Tachysurus fulvidraco]
MLLSGCQDSVMLICFFIALVGADSFLGSLPPPVNLSLSWDQNSLDVNINWREPAGLDTKYKVIYMLAIYKEKCPPKNNTTFFKRAKTLHCQYSVSKEEEICVGIKTVPENGENKIASKEVYKYLPPPLALVENFKCVYYATKQMNCTWTVVKNTPDLQLLYKIGEQTKSCMSYLSSGHIKTGCHLHDKDLTSNGKVFFVISTTGKNNLNNKFKIEINFSVKPPKPEVHITKEGELLYFQAIIPRDFLAPQCLKYKFVYTRCNERSEEITINSSLHVEYDTACMYKVRVHVIYSNYCGTDHDIEGDPSEPGYYGEDDDPNLAFKLAMIVTPLIVCCCLVAALLMFRRIKNIILPKIPEPSLFFKDMLNSTSDGLSKGLGGKLYVPVKDIVASGVRLEPKSILLSQNHDTCI